MGEGKAVRASVLPAMSATVKRVMLEVEGSVVRLGLGWVK